jgi:hypothetical protein
MADVPAAGIGHRTQELLRALAGQQATLREDQLAAIQALVVTASADRTSSTGPRGPHGGWESNRNATAPLGMSSACRAVRL